MTTPNPLTPARIRELLELCEKAPKGPFTGIAASSLRDASGKRIVSMDNCTDPQADYIREACNALPSALNEIVRLRGLLEEALSWGLYVYRAPETKALREDLVTRVGDALASGKEKA